MKTEKQWIKDRLAVLNQIRRTEWKLAELRRLLGMVEGGLNDASRQRAAHVLTAESH